jgi:hypothetical protein
MRCIPGVVGRTTGGANQYMGTFGIDVSGGGATLEYSRMRRPRASWKDSVTVPAAGAFR